MSIERPLAPDRSDYFLILLFICLSGNQAFVTGLRNEVLLLATALVLAQRMILTRRGILTREFFGALAAYSLILTHQYVTLSYMSFSTAAGFLVKLVVAVGIISTVKFFRFAYVRAMVWLATLSLIIHIITVGAAFAGIRFYELMMPIAEIVGAQPEGTNLRVNILIHNFMDGAGLYRNSGIFWEPGAFSGYLLIAILFLATIQKYLHYKTLRKWRIILALSLLSTLSTSGFILLPFALFTFKLMRLEEKGEYANRYIWLTFFLLALVPLTAFFWQLGFLGPKIEALIARAVNQDPGWQLSRFGAILFDWTHIRERPLFGWSQTDPAVYSLYAALQRFETGNGLSGFVREFGALGMLLFLAFFWRGLSRLGITRWSRLMVFALIVFQLNGQSYLTYPLYLGMHFLSLERKPTSRRQVARSDDWTMLE